MNEIHKKKIKHIHTSDLRPANLLKRRLWDRCFPVNFAKLARTPFLQNITERQPVTVFFFNNINIALLLVFDALLLILLR